MSIKRNSKVTMKKRSKLTALIARLSLMIAKKENPSGYKRYKTARTKYLQLKRQLMKKYTSKAIIVAREIIKTSK
ncbi:hypothetical protein HN385_07775 [archaeon]|jgi:hypothetical protein|nr:hypothetical protein [archaeon]